MTIKNSKELPKISAFWVFINFRCLHFEMGFVTSLDKVIFLISILKSFKNQLEPIILT